MDKSKKRMPDESAAAERQTLPGGGVSGRRDAIGAPVQDTAGAAGAVVGSGTTQEAADAGAALQTPAAVAGSGAAVVGELTGGTARARRITPERVREATQILQRYKAGKANLERKIVENEKWWRLRHWEAMRHESAPEEPTPASAWLFNCLANKHADAMDNYPMARMFPREEADEGEAETLSDVLPVILEQNDFEQVYDRAWWYKLKQGCCAYAVRWVPDKCNGIGDVDFDCVDLLQLFWEPGVQDIQSSRHLFCTTLAANEALEAQYPQLAGKLGTQGLEVSRYVYDDTVPTDDKSVLVDWYYKTRNAAGRPVLHYVKYVNDEVLYASEDDPRYMESGFYDHGEYPFVFDVLFPLEGTPVGFGYIDICRDPQGYIDLMNQAILENALDGATPRYFARSDASINRAQFADRRQKLIDCDGNLGADAIRPLDTKPLPSIYVEIVNNKIEELKETSGNRDVNSGGSTSGATAASAIAAMQEAGSKLSRDMIRASYRVFRLVVYRTIELIRQFYTVQRSFRITGSDKVRFVQFSNRGLLPQAQGQAYGVDLGYRVPVFDIRVTAEKSSPYSRMSQNELALQLYQLGMLDPQRADPALLALDMMDFDGREELVVKVQQNAQLLQTVTMLQQQVLQLSGIVDRATGSHLLEAAAAGGQPQTGTPPAAHSAAPVELDGRSSDEKAGEARMDRVRQEAAERSAPR